jgi:hypothetical protein
MPVLTAICPRLWPSALSSPPGEPSPTATRTRGAGCDHHAASPPTPRSTSSRKKNRSNTSQSGGLRRITPIRLSQGLASGKWSTRPLNVRHTRQTSRLRLSGTFPRVGPHGPRYDGNDRTGRPSSATTSGNQPHGTRRSTPSPATYTASNSSARPSSRPRLSSTTRAIISPHQVRTRHLHRQAT